MNTFLLATNASSQGNLLMIVAFIVLLAFSYFAMIRPQKKQNDARMKMISQLNKGDHVVLVDGLHGKIDSIDSENKTIVIDADGIYLTFSRIAVREVIPASSIPASTSEKPQEVKAVSENKETEKSEAPSETAPEKASETDSATETAKAPTSDEPKN